MNYTLDTLKFSQHSKERYAARIMDKTSASDIAVYVAQNEQKIKEDIFKMIEYGTLLYSGKSVSEFNKQPVDIFLNGTWIIIVDISKANVVTLYSIDLGLGHEFNQIYISKLLEKLEAAKQNYSSVYEIIQTDTETYSGIIKDNAALINEYKQMINNLEKQNQAYTDVIENLECNKIVAEKEIRNIIATMIGKKIF